MKNKAYDIAVFSIEMFFSLLLLIISIMFIVASIHNIKMTEEIKEFINSATFELESNNTYYYTVECDDLDVEVINRNKINENLYGIPKLGNTGDLFLMPQSRMEYFPFFSEFVSFLFGGHAGVVIDGGKRLIEAMGGSIDDGFIYNEPADLYDEERTVVGLRVDTSKETREQAAQNALSLVGKKYNYFYIFNTRNAYYCTDVCNRIYGKEFGMDYRIDTNGFHVSLQDLFRSKDTYITFVKYKQGDKTYIYYLKNTSN